MLCSISAIVISTLALAVCKNRVKVKGLYSVHVENGPVALLLHAVRVGILWAILGLLKIARRWKRWRNRAHEIQQLKLPMRLKRDDEYHLTFTGVDKLGNIASIKAKRNETGTFGSVMFRMADGRVFSIQERCQQSKTANLPTDSFAIGGLRIQILEAEHKARVLFSGLMRLDDTEQFVEVNARLCFRSLSDPSHANVDFSPLLLAKCMAEEPNPLKTFFCWVSSNSVKVEQVGELRGRWQIGSEKAEDVSLNGIRTLAKSKHLKSPQGVFSLRSRFDNGLVITLNAASAPEPGMSHGLDGYVSFQNGYVYPVRWTDFHLSQLSNGSFPDHLSVNLQAHDRIWTLKTKFLSATSFVSIDGLLMREFCVEIILNDDRRGFGTILWNDSGCRAKVLIPKKPVTLESEIPYPEESQKPPLTIALKDPLCRDASLTGGKAARLADILAVLEKEKEYPDFKIPDGFAVTTAAYQQHLADNPELAELVADVFKVAEKQKLEDLEQLCHKVHAAFVQTQLSTTLKTALFKQLQLSFGETSWVEIYTAVRSSAVGEDGVDASGAGQMETFLGRRGLEKITEAIKLCWASHFAFRAIEYRRQLCAKLDTPMAVVVQRLVRADVAGVLFTRHPDTGSTARSLINACYGIGEGVVSGHVQPDTISVYKTSPDGDDVNIVYDSLGEKASAYKLDEEKGEVTEQADNHVHDQCCLSEEEIKQLHQVGMFIESLFDTASGRDIEFAILKGPKQSQILILQARPITTADSEEEWELIHEFDSPIATDQHWITTANLQEMMPGPLTPLAVALWTQSIAIVLEYGHMEYLIKPRRRFLISKNAGSWYQHVFLNMTLMGVGIVDDFINASASLSLFGRKIEQLTVEHYVEQNDMSGKFWQFLMKFLSNKSLLFRRTHINKLAMQVDSRHPPAATDPKELYNQLVNDIEPFSRVVWDEHIKITFAASTYPILLMSILDSSQNWGPQIYDDVSVMLSSCTDVFSADVPTLLQEIGISLREDPWAREHFLKSNRTEAAAWLNSNQSGKHGELFRAFLAKHGHRCVRDSDIRETSWAQEPEKVVDALKAIVSSTTAIKTAEKKPELSVDEALATIKTPVTNFQRKILKFFLPNARVAVGQREFAKSTAIKGTDLMRRGYYRLASLMHAKGMIPDPDLLFFFSPIEIQRMVDGGSSPKLIAKALRRRKIFAKFSGLKFDELYTGHPHPIQESFDASFTALKSIKGIAVGQGCVEGVARVIRSLAEANEIQNGDILIVAYTDVGWTPYFPLLGGLVTELGGLISHGAVVAREYGLPCLVGCKRATEIIKTGDRVRIDGVANEIYILS